MSRDTYTPPLTVGRIKFLDPAPWMDDGTCRTVEDPDIFFPENESFRKQIRTAQKICSNCPVQRRCAEYALARPGLRGIWGGLTGGDRMRLRQG